MAFKTFTPGVLTSSDVNTFLMQQAVITCTSSTRPSSPIEGMTIYETDTDLYAVYTGSAWEYIGGWTSYTPTFDNGWTSSSTIAVYAQVGDIVFYFWRFIIGTVGTGFMYWSIPIEFDITGNPDQVGQSTLLDVSTGDPYFGVIVRTSGPARVEAVAIATQGGWNTLDEVDQTTPFSWQTGDVVYGYAQGRVN